MSNATQNKIVTMNGVSLVTDPIWGRDCATPVFDLSRRYTDEVIANMPVGMGWWDNDKPVPALTGHHVRLKQPDGNDECESGVVSAEVYAGNYIMPNIKHISLATEKLKWFDLRLEFCRTRGILPGRLDVIGPDGRFNTGSEYAPDFARFAMKALAIMAAELIAQAALVGDENNAYEIDGIYTQVDGGWTTTDPYLTDMNTGQVIDWQDLTGSTSLDAPILAGKTVTLWGKTYTAPAGYNFAQFINRFWLDKVQKEFARQYGGVTQWELHAGDGMGYAFLEAAACLQPCGVSGENDTALRERYRDMLTSRIARLYETDVTMPVLESGFVGQNELRIVPRALGGRPTYGLYFTPMDLILGLGRELTDLYGQHIGLTLDEEPLLPMQNSWVPQDFGSEAFYWDFEKVNAQCVQGNLQYAMGALAVGRHMWLKVVNVAAANLADTAHSTASVDGVRLYGTATVYLLAAFADTVAEVHHDGADIGLAGGPWDMSVPAELTAFETALQNWLDDSANGFGDDTANSGGTVTVTYASGATTIEITNTAAVFDKVVDSSGNDYPFNN